MFSKSFFTIAAAVLSWHPVNAQTYSACNPLFSTSCPPNTALGKSINVDFTKGSVNSFTALGNPTYDSTGAHFTVAKAGDSPQLASVFYIMFGKVTVTMKAAPGAGIVSSLVLQSDTLDEIDMEWLGADDSEVQTNYFGKGDVTTYNRGAFNPAPNNQGQFITYSIEWTQNQIVWQVGGKTVRVLTPATADANQYPESPMQVKFGSWAGGDASNPPGTISWARGPTDYSKGPFTMTVQSLAVTDYSTGTQYKYGDTSGKWGSIQAIGGKINGNSGGARTGVSTAEVPAITSASPLIPAGLGGNRDTSHQTGWPWVGTATLTTETPVRTSAPGLPSGWIITSSGKVVPANSAADLPPSTISSYPGLPSSQPGVEIITGWDDRGFATTKYVTPGWSNVPVSYDQQGFPITPTGVVTAAGGAATPSLCVAWNCGPGNKIVGTSTSTAAAAIWTSSPSWNSFAILGIAAVVVERVLL
ncbi:hypothetical protein HYALB_00005547 [Hymenoscyphus albidus]|uniref:chitinase n=1 Tax=Hymenoscyphus albidus TaxID=595503 RepID=A0A9N9M226_9HELO|nr:hypothetical protein HYALB_00005547 [Hymenoscyphus albidus]